MGMDELEGKNPEEGGEQPSQGAQPQAPEEERGARVDAAKAFFRAMYAGEEPPANASSFGQSSAAPSDVATQTACRNCEGLQHSLTEAQQKASENETLYKRMAADFENYRRRMDREREEAQSIGVKRAAEAIMPALDDLDRAMQYLNPDTPSDKLLESFQLVGNRIMQCLDSIGLKRIDSIGQLFDPRFHEPVQQIETTEYPDGVVMQELRRGYSLGDRVVRPALVNVASNATGTVTGKPEAEAEAASEEILDKTKISASEELPAESEAPAEPEGRVYDLGDIES